MLSMKDLPWPEEFGHEHKVTITLEQNLLVEDGGWDNNKPNMLLAAGEVVELTNLPNYGVLTNARIGTYRW